MGGKWAASFCHVARRTTSSAMVGARSAKKWSKGYFFTLLTVECGKIIIFTKNLRFAMGWTQGNGDFSTFWRESVFYVSVYLSYLVFMPYNKINTIVGEYEFVVSVNNL